MVQYNLTMNRGILYPNRRIYLWDLEEASNSCTRYGGRVKQKIMSMFHSILNGIDGKSYGSYLYMVTLPETIKLHYDNEYGVDTPARYIVQNIPPSYIK